VLKHGYALTLKLIYFHLDKVVFILARKVEKDRI